MNTSYENNMMAVLPSCIPDDLKKMVVYYHISNFSQMNLDSQKMVIQTLIVRYINFSGGIYLHPVTFDLSWDIPFDKIIYKEFVEECLESCLENCIEKCMKTLGNTIADYDYINDHYSGILDELESWNLDTFPFPGITHMYIERVSDQKMPIFECGEGVHIPIEEFKFSKSNPTGITIRDLIVGVFRMLSKKSCGWVYTPHCTFESMDFTDTSISLKVSFPM